MASIPGFRFDISGASGSQGLLAPKDGWKAYILPRGGYASQDSTGALITFDSASVASRFAVNDWIMAGLNISNIRQVGAVGGNSLSISGANLTITENDRIFVFGTTEPTIAGGVATYTPNTYIYKRDDTTADVYTNSKVTTDANGLVYGYATPTLYDVLIQDGNSSNQGFMADFEVGSVLGVSASDAAFFGNSVTIYGFLHSKRGPGQVRYADEFATGSSTGGIQEAINDIATVGGEVVMSTKIYSLVGTVDPLIAIPSGITLRGSGQGKSIIRVAANSGVRNIPIATSPTTGTTFICLKGFTFDGNQANQSGTGEPVSLYMKDVSQLEICDVEVKNTVADGIYVVASSSAQKHISIHDSYIHDTNVRVVSNGHGGVNIVSTAAATQVSIRNNVFENDGTGQAGNPSIAAIRVAGGSGLADETIICGNIVVNSRANGIYIATNGRILIDGNYVKSAGQQDITDGGNCIFVDTNGTGQVTVTNNVCDSVPANSDNGIELSGPITDSECICTGNRVRNILNTQKFGIGIGGFSKLTLGDNVITACTGVGIQNSTDGPTSGTDLVINGNVCFNNGLGGINVRGKRRVIITGNDCSGSASGFGMQVGEGTTLTGAEASEIVISGNVCSGNSAIGIVLAGNIIGADANTLNRTIVSSNVSYGNGGTGIEAGSIVSGTIIGNVVEGNTGHGISLLVSATDVIVDANVIKGNVGTGLYVPITPTRLVVGQANLFQGNTGGATSAYAGMPNLIGATPNVSGVLTAFLFDTTAITDLPGGYDGQVVRLIGLTATGPAIADGNTFSLTASHTVSPGDVLTLIRSGGIWYETGYTNNA